MKLTCLTT